MSDLRLRIKLLSTTLEYIMCESDISHNPFIYEAAIHAEYKALRNEELLEELRTIGKSLADFVKEQLPGKFHHMKDDVAPCFLSTATIRESAVSSRAPSAVEQQPQSSSNSMAAGSQATPEPTVEQPPTDYGIEELDLDHYRTPSQTPAPPPFSKKTAAVVDSAITDLVQGLMSGNSCGNSRAEQPTAPFGRAERQEAAAAPRPVVQQPPPSEHKFDNNNAAGPWKQVHSNSRGGAEQKVNEWLQLQSKQTAAQQPARSEVEDVAELFGRMPVPSSNGPSNGETANRLLRATPHNEENIRGPLVSFGTPTPNGSPRAPSARQSPARFVQTPPNGVSRPQARRPDSAVVPPPDFSALGRSMSAASSVHSNTARVEVARETRPFGSRPRDQWPTLATATAPPPPRPAQVQRPAPQQQQQQVASSGSRGHRQRWTRVDNSVVAFVQSVRIEKIFYAVLRGSIMNSAEVNEFRENFLRDLRRSHPEQYAEMPEILKQFESAEHSAPLAPMIEVLQQLDWMFGNSMTHQEFLKMNRLLQRRGRLPFVGARQEVMSLIDCLETKLISRQGERYFVHPDIAAVQLWRIPPGLTSNMLRMLLNEKSLLVQEISRQNGLLLDSFGRRVVVQDFDVVRQANCWPSLFFIRAEASEQQSMGTATISVYTDVPKWKLLLDSPIETNVPMTCDCDECTYGQPPCIVPELN